MKLYTKDELIETIREVSARGWHKSVKKTIDTRNATAIIYLTPRRMVGSYERNQ